MKRVVYLSLIISILMSVNAEAQVGKFLKNVKNNVQKDLFGKSDNSNKQAPEPPCACENAVMVVDVSKYNIDYTEMTVSMLDDGSILLRNNMEDTYFIIKDGVTEGPLKKSDARVARFYKPDSQSSENDPAVLYPEYIKKQGDKYSITFGGKTYGPYGQISKFAVTHSRTKFAAMVIENVVTTEEEGKKMEEAINKAKTDQEKMELAMKYSEQMQQKIMTGGGPNSMLPRLVSNIPANTESDFTLSGSMFYTTMKYDEIVLATPSEITDLKGNKIMNLQMGTYNPEDTFISSDNSKYATISYGTLTVSDGSKYSELFGTHLTKKDGKVFLAYWYYSPKNNGIMECRIPF